MATHLERQELERLAAEWDATGNERRNAYAIYEAGAYFECARELRLLLDRQYLRQVDEQQRREED